MTAYEMMLQDDQAAELFMTLHPKAYRGYNNATVFDVLDSTNTEDVLVMNTLHSGYGPIVYKTRHSAERMVQYMSGFGVFLDSMKRYLPDMIEEHTKNQEFDCIYISNGLEWGTMEVLRLSEFRDLSDIERRR